MLLRRWLVWHFQVCPSTSERLRKWRSSCDGRSGDFYHGARANLFSLLVFHFFFIWQQRVRIGTFCLSNNSDDWYHHSITLVFVLDLLLLQHITMDSFYPHNLLVLFRYRVSVLRGSENPSETVTSPLVWTPQSSHALLESESKQIGYCEKESSIGRLLGNLLQTTRQIFSQHYESGIVPAEIDAHSKEWAFQELSSTPPTFRSTTSSFLTVFARCATSFFLSSHYARNLFCPRTFATPKFENVARKDPRQWIWV